MTARQMWKAVCWSWAVIWFILGFFTIVTFLFAILSLTMLALPVGVPREPRPLPYDPRHDRRLDDPESRHGWGGGWAE